jgi:hypothetical protein
MKPVTGLLLAAVLVFEDIPIVFQKSDLDKLPAGWKAVQTGEGKGSVWKVVADDTAPGKSGYALAQTAKGPNALFNICVFEKSSFKNGELSVRMKPQYGELDQGGGLVWRYKDADNYYITRYNPLESNFRVYKVVAGKRAQLATKEELELPKDKWLEVMIKHDGDKIECYLDGKKYLETKDDTFKEAGKVGLWTKADAQTLFDMVLVKNK